MNAHHGNQLFRKLVKAVRAEYVVSSRQEKRAVAKYVVNVIRSLDPPGYFLTPDSTHLDTRTYYDIGDQRAVDKTRQALREGAPDVEQAIKDGTIRVWKVNILVTTQHRVIIICIYQEIHYLNHQHALIVSFFSYLFRGKI